ncbi:MAG: BACON domain-containing protein, partial [Candidatus Bipolaricaulia bacterium]
WASPNALLAQGQPVLEVQPASLSFQAEAGGSAPDAQTLTVTNDGNGQMDWDMADNADWLIAESSGVLDSGQSAGVNVIVLINDLDAGTYEATITVTAEQADNSPVEVPVTLTLKGATGRGELTIEPTRLDMEAQKGGNRPTQTLTIENSGNASLDWSAQTQATWLTLRPDEGSLSAGQSRNVRVAASIANLEPGSHRTTIAISSPNASRSPVRVQVTLSLSERPDQPAGPQACERGNSVFADDFSNSSSGWTQDSGGGFNWGYDEGEYRVFITEPGFLAWAWAPFNESQVPQSFCASADVKHLVTGSLTDKGEVGIIFAGNPNNNEFTLFSIANRQFYRVVRWDCGGDGCSAETLVEAVESDEIQPDAFNKLRVIAEGREARLFINGTQVETLSTQTSGAVGVMSHSFDEPNMNGRFDNFEVTELPQ